MEFGIDNFPHNNVPVPSYVRENFALLPSALHIHPIAVMSGLCSQMCNSKHLGIKCVPSAPRFGIVKVTHTKTKLQSQEPEGIYSIIPHLHFKVTLCLFYIGHVASDY